MPKTVSAVIICKNEEAMLERCLRSVVEADEIIVGDTGSKDGTLALIRKLQTQPEFSGKLKLFLDFIWTDSFSDAQNHYKKYATSDWILSIDSDEYLDVPFSEVRKAVELGKDYVAVHMVAEGGSRLEFMFSRLFRNCAEIYWCQAAHKHLNLPGEGEQAGNVRIVFGYSPAHQLDPNRTLRILEGVVEREGDEAGRNLYYLGREYYYKRDYQNATKTLGRYVQVSNWDAEKAEAFLIMSQCYSHQSLDEDARIAIAHAILINPNFKEAIEWMAAISSPENAIQWRRMAKTANNNNILWDRVHTEAAYDTIFLSVHNDDESLFGAFTLMRRKPLVIVITDSYIQPQRGDIGCDAETRRQETINAMNLVGCPVVFLGIKDTELTEEILRERLKYFNPEIVYAPAVQGGNPQHDIVGKVAYELFGKKCERYTTYSKTELYTTGGWEIKPTERELELKNKMLLCYASQIYLPSTQPHFNAVKGKSEWLI